jgi:hypothetical protein
MDNNSPPTTLLPSTPIITSRNTLTNNTSSSPTTIPIINTVTSPSTTINNNLSPIEEAISCAKQAEEATRNGNLVEAKQFHKRAKDKFELVARDMREIGDVDTAVGLDLLVAFHRTRATELRSKSLQAAAAAAAAAATSSSTTSSSQPPTTSGNTTSTTKKLTSPTSSKSMPSTQSVVASVSQAWGQMLEMGQSLLLEQQQQQQQQQQQKNKNNSNDKKTTSTTTTATMTSPQRSPSPTTTTTATTSGLNSPLYGSPRMELQSPTFGAGGGQFNISNSTYPAALGESYYIVPGSSNNPLTNHYFSGNTNNNNAAEKQYFNNNNNNNNSGGTLTNNTITSTTATSRADETPVEMEARLQSDIRVLTAILKKLEKENARLKRELKKEQEGARLQSKRFWAMFLSLKKTMDELGNSTNNSTNTVSNSTSLSSSSSSPYGSR